MTPRPPDVPFVLRSRAAFFPDSATLVVADLHLGRGVSSAVDAPIADSTNASSRARLDAVLAELGPAAVVVAGDLLHAFDRVPRGVTDALAALESTVADADASLVVTSGNHDAMLSSVFDGETRAACRLPPAGKNENESENTSEAQESVVVCHGHEPPTLDATLYVVGHDHPALSIEGRKRPCFLFGPGAYDGADVLMVPAFTELAAGATVNSMSARDFQSPLVTDANAFHPIVWDVGAEEPLWFPPLGECRQLL
ncbi:metallophosphoesterase [Natrialba asiatica]|uniref:Metallophosphoesterase n=1 Tax=Natrialba asiatica (strain ATCC 700177 / DSM 12278 / JCM 9576 / FERM P-10747 / NBRC 102637 / 172P1) TaxID=29540 RepID=M0AMI7_NATA1|nr:metallophosphoesterase [Natrialba asiatica]ELY99531.1 metallophosphoesterase [Natrialba asiatica DSM 12278]